MQTIFFKLDCHKRSTILLQIPLVVLANKQDLPGAIDLKNMEGVLQLHNLPPERAWHVQVSTNNVLFQVDHFQFV